MTVQLIVVQGKPEGKTIPLAGPLFLIGRGERCHLRPNSELVSREHTEISIGDDAVIVRDMGSRNGTLVNGKPLKGPHSLKNGELLQVGPLTFAVSIQGAKAAVAASAKPAPAKGASLDEVDHNQIDSWLVSDQENSTPERPSGVYRGETLTINAYKEAIAAKSAPQVEKESPRAVKPPEPPEPPAPVAPPAPAPVVTPPKPAPVPVAQAKPAPVPVVQAEPAPVPAPVTEAAPIPTPVAKATPPPKVAAPQPAAVSRPSYLDDIEYERLPEGVGDAGGGGDYADPDDDEEQVERDTDVAPEEFIDESNPFYVSKKAEESAVEPSKQVYLDTSVAASDILRKMMERRRSGR
ncbi:MAG: FHA domain-containing protein [Isosphaeraceae bacterium]